ncbi:hypothetical protein ACUWCL_29470, partial [Klebsiella pneumoniae]|uniref:hypothetical protein n=1 Tax=Klebsiella pneumoniae TaxID=573 RepID=UPI0040554993
LQFDSVFILNNLRNKKIILNLRLFVLSYSFLKDAIDTVIFGGAMRGRLGFYFQITLHRDKTATAARLSSTTDRIT